MNIVFITGNHPRHKFIARKIASSGFLKCVISEIRESHVPSPPDSLDNESAQLFRHHFKRRESAESKFFGKEHWPDCEVIAIERKSLNSSNVQTILKQDVDLLLSYGCHMLSEETLECVKGHAWNIHGGLSPWYRGAITHFWPSYLLQPQMTGMTVHELTQQLDAGDVIHQNVADLVRGDGLHELSCRAVSKMGDELPTLIQKLHSNQPIEANSHKTTGKLWLGKDWRPEHLHLIYSVYGDRVVNHYLDGRFEKSDPVLHRQF